MGGEFVYWFRVGAEISKKILAEKESLCQVIYIKFSSINFSDAMKPEIKVRIAPSPTGYLHIGTARTALFNYLFAKKMGGKFLLRIEDTDFARNNENSYNSILNGLKWLGLNWEGEAVYQSKRMEMHSEMALKLIQNSAAYYCYVSPEEISKRKEEAEKNGTRYIHKYSEGDETLKEGIKPVIRVKVPRNQDIINDDLVQGKVVINSETIEDFVIVRNDGTPVYMLSVVCDDIEMGITHVIRGDDHLINTPKQILIYKGLNAKLPFFAHIPLIHGSDGKKLSKRHGALGVEEYKEMGYLPEAIRSYLFRLGLGSENDSILNDSQMIQEFSIESITKAPSRFDFEKLNNINHHFISTLPEDYILNKILENTEFANIETIKRAVFKIRYRYNKISEMQEEFQCFDANFTIFEEAENLINDNKPLLSELLHFFKNTPNEAEMEANFKIFLKEKSIPFSKAGPLIRASLIGKLSSIGIFEIIYILGLKESIARIEGVI